VREKLTLSKTIALHICLIWRTQEDGVQEVAVMFFMLQECPIRRRDLYMVSIWNNRFEYIYGSCMFPFLSDYFFNVFGLCMADLVCNFSHFPISPTQNIPRVFKK
jgi:hypothetical protein